MVENHHNIIFEMNFDITFCSSINNILTDILSHLFWPYNTLAESGGEHLIKNRVDKKNLIKYIDTKVERKRKYAVDNVLEEKKKRKLHAVSKGKDKLILCDTSVSSRSLKVIILRETSDLLIMLN
jgi:hypothetical protein